jgi:hypothetical protein
LKISIITVCFNSENTIQDTINSVIMQDYNNIEYIIIDGDSTDKTNEIIEKNISNVHKYISEKDHGLYDAINKGIEISTGDIIGILNSDDTYSSTKIISKIAECFSNRDLQLLYADIAFVDNNLSLKRIYSSKYWKPNLLKYGFMPAHPTFYCRKELYNKYGLYKLNYKIAADFELIARFFTINKNLIYMYVPHIFVNMKLGGLSTNSFKSKLIIINEIMNACRTNAIQTNYIFLFSKYFIKSLLYFIELIKSSLYEKK